jgi:hypothetical protein
MSKIGYTPENIELLNRLHATCRKVGVGYTTVYEECADTWYITIDSPAPSENFVGKSRGLLENALTDAIEFVEKLGA